MTNRERDLMDLGIEYAEGIERCQVIELPSGLQVQRAKYGWAAQPWNDTYWRELADLLDAMRFATPPPKGPEVPSRFADEHALRS
jgi:hypothetical protein